MIDFSPLWETTKEKGISQYDLLNMGIDKRALDRLRNNKYITLLSLEKLCNILHCTPDSVIKFIPDDSEDDKAIKDTAE